MPKNRLYIVLTALLFIAIGSGGLIFYINSKRKKEQVVEQEPTDVTTPITTDFTLPTVVPNPTTTPTPVVDLPVIRVMDEDENLLSVLMMYKGTKLLYQVTDKDDLPAHERNGLIFDAMKMPNGFKFFIENQAGRRIAELMVESSLGAESTVTDKKTKMGGIS